MMENITSSTTLVVESQQTSFPLEDMVAHFINLISDFQTLWPVLLLIVALLISFVAPFRMNNITHNTLDKLKQSGKYIRDIYVEPNGIAETLRYFIFGFRKKRQLIRRYSSLFIGPSREALKKHGHRVCFSYFTPWKKIVSELEKEVDWFRHCEKDCHRPFRSSEESRDLELFAISYSHYRQALDSLLEDARLVRAKYCHLIGGAGCGKTNLMCSMAEAALANHYPCILVCAGDIKEDVNQAIINALNLPAFMRNYAQIVFCVTNIRCLLSRRKMIIMIDAINENDSKRFATTINQFVGIMSKYRSAKILFSCREEYYEQRTCRYEKDVSAPSPYVYKPNYAVKQKNVSEILIPGYKKHFAFTGELSDHVEYKLRTNMLLLRVFFEAFRGSSEHIVTIDKYQVFSKYISLITKDDPNVAHMIEALAAKMVDQKCFDSIRLDTFSQQEQDIYRRLATDGGVLLVTKLVDNPQSIIEKRYECISFVYDELRDYCLARHLLMNCTAQLPNILTQMKATVATPLEGIVKYCYEHYKSLQQFAAAKQLLYEYGFEQSRKESRHYHTHSIGFSMILESGSACTDYEISYIVNRIDRTHRTRYELDLIDFVTDEKRNPDIANRFVDQILESNHLQQVVKFADFFLDSYSVIRDPWYSNMAETIRMRHHTWKEEGTHPVGYARLHACLCVVWEKRNELAAISKEMRDEILRDLLMHLQKKEGISPEIMSCIMNKSNSNALQDYLMHFFWNEKHGCMLKHEDYHDPAYSSIDRFYYSKHRLIALPLLIRLRIIPNTYMGSRIKLLFREFTWHSFNMYSEYRKYYQKEMPSYCEYLKQKHYFTENEYNTWLCKKWRCKVYEDGLGHCTQGLLSSKIILETLQQYLGGEI